MPYTSLVEICTGYITIHRKKLIATKFDIVIPPWYLAVSSKGGGNSHEYLLGGSLIVSLFISSPRR